MHLIHIIQILFPLSVILLCKIIKFLHGAANHVLYRIEIFLNVTIYRSPNISKLHC